MLKCPFDLKCSCYINITWLHDGHFGLNVRVRRDRLPSAMRKNNVTEILNTFTGLNGTKNIFQKSLNNLRL